MKYKELPQDLKDQVLFTYGHVRRSQNPTVNHILKTLYRTTEKYINEGATATAVENMTAIKLLQEHIKNN